MPFFRVPQIDKFFRLFVFAIAAFGSSSSFAQQTEHLNVVGFEQAIPGKFDSLTTALGVWKPDTPRSIIDNKHAKTGKQCLQLMGGPTASVTLTLAKNADTSGQLVFWAERWTRRNPFSFRIEKFSNGKWSEIFNGDQKIKVGRAFLSLVRVPLGDDDISKLRFSVTSPAATGILIDDVRLAPAKPQRIVSVKSLPLTLPVLVGKKANPMARLEILTEGNLNPISLSELQATLHAHTKDLENAQFYFGGSNSSFDAASPFGNPLEFDRNTNRGDAARNLLLKANGKQTLVDGTNHVWLSARLDRAANLDRKITVTFNNASFSSRETWQIDPLPMTQRFGVALRKAGDDKVHTFRIPGLVTTNAGTLIGVYDVRWRSGGDLPGDIDVGMSRSTDGGKSWEPMKTIMNMGNNPKWRYDGIGDPAILVDRATGTIWVAATWSHGNRSWNGSGPGLSPEETGQLMLVRSDDDGKTWSKPINITRQIKDPKWSFILQGPGKGITMQDGTIVFAAQYQDPPNAANRQAHRLPHSTIIYSKDHGHTWQVGTGAFDDTTESQVVEIAPGVLMLNCRYNRKSARVVMTTRDMGKTWEKHETSELALIEPRACMASLISVDQELKGKIDKRLLFSNPDSIRGRNHLTIKGSLDAGKTWPKQYRLLLDEGNGRGYSCLTMIDSETVGILYEGSQSDLTFQRIPLADVLGQSQPGKKKESPRDNTPIQKTPSGKTLSLSKVFGSHMVLQANGRIPIWGKSRPNANVVIQLGDEKETVKADQEGNWQVAFTKRTPNTNPIKLTVESESDRIELVDILIGEVWMCAGQSNMAWPLRLSDNRNLEPSTTSRKQVRLMNWQSTAQGNSGSYTLEQLGRLTAETYGDGNWKIASKENSNDFSAVAWYFGNALQKELKVPVGLISVAVGGSPTESWIPAEALKKDRHLHELVSGNWLDNPKLGDFCRTRGLENLLPAIQSGEIVPRDDMGPNHPFKPGFLWKATVKPFCQSPIRGVIWYQGESNAETKDRVHQHEHLFPLLVESWRMGWNRSDLPFYFVQLPAMDRPFWPLFREQQRLLQDRLDNVEMAVTIDTGHPTNVHPSQKKPVGDRLAFLALESTYQLNKLADASGPFLESIRSENHELILRFKKVAEGLASEDKKPPRHFEVSGIDGTFFPAEATILGKNQISLVSHKVSSPKSARYAWTPFPTPPVNLINSNGIPASPFTTETLKNKPSRNETLERNENQSSRKADRVNILFLVSEDNGDHLGCYGESRVHTPHLDQLAKTGVLYERAYVPYSVCSPSRAAFLTGLYPRQNGHIGLATHRFSTYQDFKTMPSYFKSAGYLTGFIGKTHINPERLVEDFIDLRSIRESNFGKTISIENYARRAGEVFDKAVENNLPFFLTINFADAHRKFIGKSKNGYPGKMVTEEIKPFPWIGSDTPELRKELQNYFNCINRLDEGIGMVLKRLEKSGLRENTLVVYISDHGSDFPRAKGSIYENGTRIPMIVNFPKEFSRNRKESSLVSTLEILPTMLRSAGLPVPASLPGIALQDIDTGKSSGRKHIHTFTTGSSPNLLYVQFGIRDDRFKLIFNPDRSLNLLAVSRYKNSKIPKDKQLTTFLFPPEFELYDLKEDPHERKNLADNPDFRRDRDRLWNEMREFQNRIRDPFSKKQNLEAFIAEQKKYQTQKYRFKEFRWSHLDMFRIANSDN